jgi:hypothetical protein
LEQQEFPRFVARIPAVCAQQIGGIERTDALKGLWPKSWPELRIRSAAAQTRIVSAGRLWPGRRELSRLFKYMACARIPEFESYSLGPNDNDFRACAAGAAETYKRSSGALK